MATDKQADSVVQSEVVDLLKSLFTSRGVVAGAREMFPGSYEGKTTETGHEEVHQHNLAMIPFNQKIWTDAMFIQLSQMFQQTLRFQEEWQDIRAAKARDSHQLQTAGKAFDKIWNLESVEAVSEANVLGTGVAQLATVEAMAVAIARALVDSGLVAPTPKSV